MEDQKTFITDNPIHLTCHWRVTINGYKLSAYEVRGLDEKHDIIEYRGSGFDKTTHLSLGKCKPGQITITWAVISSNEPGAFIYQLWKDRTQPKKTVDGKPDRREVPSLGVNIEITLLDRNLNEVMQWNLKECAPMEYKGPTLKADESEVAMQSLVIRFTSISSTVPHWMPLKQRDMYKW